jgi:serine/threonine protein kinase
MSMSQMIRYRKRLCEDEARYYLKSVFEGLEYLKSKKIIHRDLKLANLLLDGNMKVKIGRIPSFVGLCCVN